jgi:anti-anti-sigma factor
MASQPLISRGLKLQLEEKANETIVHCAGKINAENSDAFQKEIRDLIAEFQGNVAAINRGIVLDLSNVTHVDSTGMGALLGAWTAAKSKGCDLEMANLNPRVEKLVEITKLDTVFKRARVVAAGSTATPTVDHAQPALDPEEAWQQAIEAGMVVHRANPLNCETSIPALMGGVVMPNPRFYVRNHFQIPRLDPSSWRLNVVGLVERPLSLSLRDLVKMPSQSQFVTLECAGNGRSLLNPRVNGEQWNLGAVSTAEWTGVPLVEVLERAGVKAGAREVVFRGADSGKLDASSESIRFERSLSMADAHGSEALLAYAMNGETLPIQHGYPLRVIVPGWYAVASVKWLTEVDVISGPFNGHYQTETYFYEWQRSGQLVREQVSLQRVRSLITEPEPDTEVEQGDLPIRGVAWSGAAPIARVEVSIGGGPWQDARLVGERKRHSWQGWELIAFLEQPGSTVISARATDMTSRTQHDSPEWNRLWEQCHSEGSRQCSVRRCGNQRSRARLGRRLSVNAS